MTRLKQWLAVRRLNKLIAKSKASFAVQDYARRRAAAKLGIARKAQAA